MGKKKKKGYRKDQSKPLQYDLNQGIYKVIEKELTDEVYNNDTQKGVDQNKYGEIIETTELTINKKPQESPEKVNENIGVNKEQGNDCNDNKKDPKTIEQLLTPNVEEIRNDTDLDKVVQINDNVNSPIIDIPLGDEDNQIGKSNSKEVSNNSEVIEDINYDMPIQQDKNEETTKIQKVILQKNQQDVQEENDISPETFDEVTDVKTDIKNCPINDIEPQIEIGLTNKSQEKPMKMALLSNDNKTNENQLHIEPEFTIVSKPNQITEAQSKSYKTSNYNTNTSKSNILKHQSIEIEANYSGKFRDTSNNKINAEMASTENPLSQSYRETEINNEFKIVKYSADVPKTTNNILNEPKAFTNVPRIPVIVPPKDDSCCIIQ